MQPIAPSIRYTDYNPVVPTTTFEVGFPIFSNDDVRLLHDGEPVEFTVTATYVENVSTDAVCVVAEGITGLVEVVGNRTPRRTDQYQDGRPLPIRDHNYSLNRLTAESQEARRDLTRSIRVKISAGDPGDLDPVPGRVISFDDDGNAVMAANSAAEATLEAIRSETARLGSEVARDASVEAKEESEFARDESVEAKDASQAAESGSLNYRNQALGFRNQAELAAAAATLALGMLYDTPEIGAGETEPGDYFWVKGEAGGDIYASLYKNVADVGVDQELALATHRAIFDRFRNAPDDDYAQRYTDLNNFQYGAFTVGGAFEIGKTWLAQVNFSRNYLSGRDGKDFIWADIGGDVNELAGLRWRNIPGVPGFEVAGGDGFLIFSTEFDVGSGSAGGGGGSSETPKSLVPWFGPHLAGFDGEDTTIYVAQVLQYREQDAHLVEASLLGETGSGGDAQPTLLKVDTGKLGKTATLQVRPRKWNGGSSRFLPLAVQNVKSVAQGATPLNFTFLGIGDSIQNGAMTALMAYELSLRGHTMTGIGTSVGDGINNFFGTGVHLAGMMDEGHGGWELADILFSVNDSGKDRFVGAGQLYATVAAYFAASAIDQQNCNTMLRPATGGDPVDDIRNGMIMDLDFYFSRFAEGASGVPSGRGVALPDVWGCNFLTNDARDRPGTLQQNHFDNYSLLFRRIRLVSDRPIVCWPVGTPRDPGRDALWSTGYINGIKGILNAIEAAEDDLIFMHPAFAMNDQNGIGYILRDATPDPDSGSSDTGYGGNVHPLFGARRQMARNGAAAIAFAASL